MIITASFEDHFWSKVDKRSADECWEWRGTRKESGYGRHWLPRLGRYQQAHRVMWELRNGPVPAGQCVCHRCDNPGCVNPGHLFLATHLGNMRDKVAKGRAARQAGERHPGSKLTEAEVAGIRVAYASENITQRQLAKRYGVVQRTVARIVTGVGWRNK